MPAAGSTSPSWSNEDADDFWDENLSALEDGGASDLDANKTEPPQDKNVANRTKRSAADQENETTSVPHKAIGSLEHGTAPENQENQGNRENDDLTTKSHLKGQSSDQTPSKKASKAKMVGESANSAEKAEKPSLEQQVNVPVEAKPVADESKPDLANPGTTKANQLEDNVKAANVAENGGISAPDPSETVASLKQMSQVSEALQELESASDFLDDGKEGELATTLKQTEASDSKALQKTISIDELNENVSHDQNGQEKNQPPRDTKEHTSHNIATSESEKVSEDTHVAQLTKQINALKLELEEKDLKLQQMEKTNDALKLSEDSLLTERLQELEENLEKTEQERDQARNQLEGFLSKISSMKTVFQNFKETQKELEEVKQQLAEALEEKEKEHEESRALADQVKTLEQQKMVLEEHQGDRDAEKQKYLEIIDCLKKEALEVNSECDRLSQLLTTVRRELQTKEEVLQDEKYTLENEVSRLNKKLSDQKNTQNELELMHEEAVVENKNLVASSEELKERLQEKETVLRSLQEAATEAQEALEAKIAELERSGEEKDQKIEEAKLKASQLEADAAQAKQSLDEREGEMEKLRKDQEKIKLLEEEVQNKQLTIGKLRHEAIILNEHLTKSLSMLKQNLGDSNTTVDRELISNLLLNFVQIPRGDTKKFEALLLIAGLLEWDDEKKVQAGLMHNGSKDDAKPHRLGLISLWTDFLDRESAKK